MSIKCFSVVFGVTLSSRHTLGPSWSSSPAINKLRHLPATSVINSLGWHTILVFAASNTMAIFRREPPNGGVEFRGYKKSRFSTNMSLYLRNDTRYGHSYYRRRIGNRTHAFEWYNFQWPWVTLNPHFKVTILFNVKYNNSRTVQDIWQTNSKSYMIYPTAPF